jgi:hypothetical protein
MKSHANKPDNRESDSHAHKTNWMKPHVHIVVWYNFKTSKLSKHPILSAPHTQVVQQMECNYTTGRSCLVALAEQINKKQS